MAPQGYLWAEVRFESRLSQLQMPTLLPYTAVHESQYLILRSQGSLEPTANYNHQDALCTCQCLNHLDNRLSEQGTPMGHWNVISV